MRCAFKLFLLWMLVSLPLLVLAQTQSRKLVWSDEFDGAAGSSPDLSKWDFDGGGNGWGNNELQYYTNRSANAFLNGQGHLGIRAIRETYTGKDGVTREYTSARMVTNGKFAQQYGRIEARLKLPTGRGIWPAFWMLGNDLDAVGWPQSGEIDIMEHKGSQPGIVSSALHGPGHSGGLALTKTYRLPRGKRFTDDFHVFAIEWEPQMIRWYVDGKMYHRRAPADLRRLENAKWVFDHPFFILLNVAVGGHFDGVPDASTKFPQTMLVDYVRVYEQKNKGERTARATGNHSQPASRLSGKTSRHSGASR